MACSEFRPLTPRQRELIALVELHGHATIPFLVQALGCSAPSVRRDIRRLCEERLIQRFHGGASASSGPVRLGYAAKQHRMSEEKARIATRAVRLLGEVSSLFLDTGSTCDRFAQALGSCRGFFIVTHNPSAALILAAYHNEHRIQLLGGLVGGADGAVTGSRTVRELESYRLETAVVAVSGIDAEGYLLDFDSHKIDIKRAMMACARQSFLLIDRSRFRRRGLQRVAHLNDFDRIVTDAMPAAQYRALIDNSDQRLVIAA